MTLHRSLAHPIMRRSGERPQVIESPVPSSPLLRSAVLALGLAGAGPASAEITVAVARITEGALWVIGQVDQPEADVTIDGAFTEKADRRGYFASGWSITPIAALSR